MTITEMSVPLKVSTVTAAADILSEILSLIIGQRINEEMLTKCIEQGTNTMTKAN